MARYLFIPCLSIDNQHKFSRCVFAVPEPNQPEQLINAYYIQKMGYGVACELEDISLQKVQYFLNNFRQRDQKRINGVYEAVKIIHSYLGI